MTCSIIYKWMTFKPWTPVLTPHCNSRASLAFPVHCITWGHSSKEMAHVNPQFKLCVSDHNLNQKDYTSKGLGRVQENQKGTRQNPELTIRGALRALDLKRQEENRRGYGICRRKQRKESSAGCCCLWKTNAVNPCGPHKQGAWMIYVTHVLFWHFLLDKTNWKRQSMEVHDTMVSLPGYQAWWKR